jgi:hypothetical protein
VAPDATHAIPVDTLAQVTFTPPAGGALQPVKLAADAWIQSLQVLLGATKPLVRNLTVVVAEPAALVLGLEEVKVTVAGVTL